VERRGSHADGNAAGPGADRGPACLPHGHRRGTVLPRRPLRLAPGRLPVAVTITATAGLFALEHAYYPILLPLVIGYGLAAGWVRHRTQSTVATIAMHITVDFALFAAAVALS
jgi:membrane protease YdiL (CAAX protease family)